LHSFVVSLFISSILRHEEEMSYHWRDDFIATVVWLSAVPLRCQAMVSPSVVSLLLPHHWQIDGPTDGKMNIFLMANKALQHMQCGKRMHPYMR